MSQALTVGLIGLTLFNGQALAPGEDDWEYAENPAQHLSVAAVRYDDGKAVIARCQSGELKLVIAGLPAGVTGPRVFDASRADGRADHAVWTAETGGALVSTAVGRDARFLRGGGVFQLRSSAGQTSPMRVAFDLPTQNANLDRVMTNCGWALADDRDALARIPVDLHPPVVPFRGGERRRRELEAAPIGWIVDMSCVVRDLKLADCRVDHQLPAGQDNGAVAIRATEGDLWEGVEPAAAEGTVAFITFTTQTILREELVSTGR